MREEIEALQGICVSQTPQFVHSSQVLDLMVRFSFHHPVELLLKEIKWIPQWTWKLKCFKFRGVTFPSRDGLLLQHCHFQCHVDLVTAHFVSPCHRHQVLACTSLISVTMATPGPIHFTFFLPSSEVWDPLLLTS